MTSLTLDEAAEAYKNLVENAQGEGAIALLYIEREGMEQAGVFGLQIGPGARPADYITALSKANWEGHPPVVAIFHSEAWAHHISMSPEESADHSKMDELSKEELMARADSLVEVAIIQRRARGEEDQLRSMEFARTKDGVHWHDVHDITGADVMGDVADALKELIP